MATQAISGKAARLQALSQILRVKPFVKITASEVEHIASGRTISSAIFDRIETLPSGILYAVRSSADGEDGTCYAWAGQFTTELNVEKKDLKRAILACADAVNSPSVAAYAATHDITTEGLEIIVQEMVDAEYAGAIFTKNPVGNDTCMVVEVVPGIADELLSGRVDPLRYYLHPETGVVVKTEGLNGFCLSGDQISEIFQTAILIRSHFGGEEDIEWAIERGTEYLYINQSRPITALENVFDDATVVAGEISAKLREEKTRLADLDLIIADDVLSNQNIAELITDHPTQMSHGLFCLLFAHGDGAIRRGRNLLGYDLGDELDNGFHLLIAGKPRCSIVHDALTYRIRGIPLPAYRKMVDGYVRRIKADERLAHYPEVALYDQDPSREILEDLFGPVNAALYREAYDAFFKRIRAAEDELSRKCTDEFLPWWQALLDKSRNSPSTPDEAAAMFQTMCDHLRTQACTMFVQVARLGFFAYARTRSALIRRFGPRSGEWYLNTLLGVSSADNPNALFNQALSELHIDPAMLNRVLNSFGHLAEHELEISFPRYREQPELLIALASKIISPTDTSADNERKAGEAEQQLALRLGETWPELERDIKMARTYLTLREVVKFNYLKGYDILRSLVVALEQMLGWDEGLIFHLDPVEVFRLPQEAVELKDVATVRRNERERHEHLHVPAVVFSDNLVAIGRPVRIGSDRTLRGVGVTNHVCEGRCVVVTSLMDSAAIEELKAGSILVTQMTDPAWSPIFRLIGKHGGVVTEVGGLLAHTATCAREQGLAGVLNVSSATSILKTGMCVRVDGPAGIVEILSDD